MTQTRLNLDAKLLQLENRAHDLTPRRYVRRHMPDRLLLERVVGTVLTLAGAAIAWYRFRSHRRARVLAS